MIKDVAIPGTVQTFFEDLSSLDAFFLYAERPEAPLHVGAVYVFEGRPQVRGGRGAQGIARTLEERLPLVPRYRQRVRFRMLNLGHPVWVDDEDFDLTHHLQRVTLPAPGSDAALRELAARAFANPLDTSRPLWELTLVEGLSGNRVALISKVHHAMVDGVSNVDVGTLLLDPEPEPAAAQPMAPWRARPGPDERTLASRDLDGLRRTITSNPILLPFRAPRLIREAVDGLVGTPWAGAASLALSFVRPGHHLFFNRVVGPSRALRHVSVSLADLKGVKEVMACTVNDVVLAVVAEATSRWLVERGEDVPERMRVFLPVSVRDDSSQPLPGNRVGGVIVELPLRSMPLVTRLARIAAEVGDLKKSRQALAAQTLTETTRWAPATLQALAGRLAAEPQLSLQSVVNMVVTNVPGPQSPFYTGGARLLEVWPLVPIYHMLGLSVAVVSYDGMMHVGLLADPNLIPDLDRLSRHVARAAADYATLARRLNRMVAPGPRSPRRETRRPRSDTKSL
jgi:WS/DGAT/MGAT family acyltransferase